eukprot:GHRR01022823.1.p2 GENE.GHRR01022823.1~~GHRR01022823.1.p2  ORF type:complete len:104 (-),score=18.24 GHRR01022823.1:755-1066(-)
MPAQSTYLYEKQMLTTALVCPCSLDPCISLAAACWMAGCVCDKSPITRSSAPHCLASASCKAIRCMITARTTALTPTMLNGVIIPMPHCMLAVDPYCMSADAD